MAGIAATVNTDGVVSDCPGKDEHPNTRIMQRVDDKEANAGAWLSEGEVMAVSSTCDQRMF